MKRALSILFAAASIGAFADIRAVTPQPRPHSECNWYTNWCVWLEKELNDHPHAYDVAFIGDSITHGWNSGGKKLWDAILAKPPYNAVLLGLSGDRTENCLWRLGRGILTNQTFKAIVLMIGTNNTGFRTIEEEPPIDTILGIEKIVKTLRAAQPQAKIILHPIFPRGRDWSDRCRIRNAVVSKEIQRLADNRNVLWCDFNDKFMDAEGNLVNECFSDGVHLCGEGFELWLNELLPYLNWALAPTPGAFPSQIRPRRYPAVDFIGGEAVEHRLLYGQFPSRGDRLLAKRNAIKDSDGSFDLVMIGDSITEGWEGAGKDELAKLSEGRKVLNLGWGGTGCQQLSWLMTWGGHLTGYKAKTIMFMFGTNNSAKDEHALERTVKANVRALTAILAEIRERQPEAKILLHAILERGDGEVRAKCNRRVNDELKKLCDGERTVWVDLNPALCDAEGRQKPEFFAKDRIHLTPAGYRVWREGVDGQL